MVNKEEVIFKHKEKLIWGGGSGVRKAGHQGKDLVFYTGG